MELIIRYLQNVSISLYSHAIETTVKNIFNGTFPTKSISKFLVDKKPTNENESINE